MPGFKTAGINISLRALEVASKFTLTIIITAFGNETLLGDYSIVLTTVTIAYLFLGMDFYTFSHREIIQHPSQSRGKMIYDQIAWGLFISVFVIVLFFLIGQFNPEFPFLYHGFYVMLLLPSEFINQEIYRFLILFGKTSLANLMSFIRNGFWVLLLGGILYFDLNDFSLELLIGSWALCSWIAFFIGLYLLGKFQKLSVHLLSPINISWLKQGLISALPFFVSTLFLKVLEFANRYILLHFSSKSTVGVFVFYAQFASIINILLNVAVLAVYYPKFLHLANNNKELIKIRNKCRTIITLSYLLLGPLCYVFQSYYLQYFANDRLELKNNLNIYWLVLLGSYFSSLTVLSDYVLYTKHFDKVLAYVTIITGTLSFLIVFFMTKYLALFGVALGTAISFFVLWLFKYYYERAALSVDCNR